MYSLGNELQIDRILEVTALDSDASRFDRICNVDLWDEWFACKYMQTSIVLYFGLVISERSGVFDSGSGM